MSIAKYGVGSSAPSGNATAHPRVMPIPHHTAPTTTQPGLSQWQPLCLQVSNSPDTPDLTFKKNWVCPCMGYTRTSSSAPSGNATAHTRPRVITTPQKFTHPRVTHAPTHANAPSGNPPPGRCCSKEQIYRTRA